MKKINIFVFVFLCVMFLPIMANAKEKCTVVSGNKTDIGSEVACGSEHFYIVNSDEKEVKMLAKYNLDVGISVHKEEVKKEPDDTRTDEEYCNDLAIEKGGDPGISIMPGYCFYFTYADFSNVKQRVDAKSSAVDENEDYIYPQIGNVYVSLGYFYGNTNETGIDFYINPYDIYNNISNPFESEKYDNHFGDLEPKLMEAIENDYRDPTGIYNAPSKYVNELGASLYYYKNNLSDYSINDVTLLTLEDLNNIATKRGKPMSYQTMYENGIAMSSSDSNITKFEKLKDHVNKEDAWLYDRSYWLRTGYSFRNTEDPYPSYFNYGLLFVDNLGTICGAASTSSLLPGCQAIWRVAVGSGVRPVITINTEDIVEPPRTIINNPQTGSITVLVLVGLCGLLFIGRKTLKRIT